MESIEVPESVEICGIPKASVAAQLTEVISDAAGGVIGAIENTGGLKTAEAKPRTAANKCKSLLRRSLELIIQITTAIIVLPPVIIIYGVLMSPFYLYREISRLILWMKLRSWPIPLTGSETFFTISERGASGCRRTPIFAALYGKFERDLILEKGHLIQDRIPFQMKSRPLRFMRHYFWVKDPDFRFENHVTQYAGSMEECANDAEVINSAAVFWVCYFCSDGILFQVDHAQLDAISGWKFILAALADNGESIPIGPAPRRNIPWFKFLQSIFVLPAVSFRFNEKSPKGNLLIETPSSGNSEIRWIPPIPIERLKRIRRSNDGVSIVDIFLSCITGVVEDLLSSQRKASLKGSLVGTTMENQASVDVINEREVPKSERSERKSSGDSKNLKLLQEPLIHEGQLPIYITMTIHDRNLFFDHRNIRHIQNEGCGCKLYVPLQESRRERLKKIHDSTTRLKKSPQAISLYMAHRWLGANLLSEEIWEPRNIEQRFAFLATCPPGPEVPISICGNPVTEAVMSVVRTRNTGLGLIMNRYGDHLSVSVSIDENVSQKFGITGREFLERFSKELELLEQETLTSTSPGGLYDSYAPVKIP